MSNDVQPRVSAESFSDFLLRHVEDDSPRGDLARDFQQAVSGARLALDLAAAEWACSE